MRLLFATGISRRRLPPPQLAEEQILCGPDWADRVVGDHFISMATPLEDYDLAALAARLGPEQKPDAVVCLVDRRWRGIPHQLGSLDCPKVLLVAGSNPPLARIWRYLQSETFDRVVFLHRREDAEQFRAAGCAQAVWFPALALPHRDRDLEAGRQAERDPRIAVAGSDYHPERCRLTQALTVRGLPVAQRVLPWDQRLDFYASSQVGLNASDDAECDLRPFEILASGALLLTSRPAPKSGFAELWEEGREIATFGTDAELAEKAAYYLARPTEARMVAESGRRWYEERFGEFRRRSAWQELIVAGRIPEEFSLPSRSVGVVQWAEAEEKPVMPTLSEEGRKLHQARSMMEAGDYEHAFAVAQEVLNQNPRSLDALFLMAELLRESGNPTVFLKTLNMVRRVCPQDPRIAELEQVTDEPRQARMMFRKMRAAWGALELHCWDEATRLAELILKINPNRSDALFVTGVAQLQLGRKPAGLELLRRAARLDPARMEYWFELGLALRRQGELPEAGKAFARAVDRAPDSAEAWLALGEAKAEAGYWEAAALAFARVLQLQPENGFASRGLQRCRSAGIAVAPATSSGRPRERDLLICTSETNRRHGQGVLLLRYFPPSDEFVTLRCLSGYEGDDEFGGASIQLEAGDLTDAEALARLRRLLEPYRIRRILCVPYHPFDFRRAVLVKKLTSARLCTFVMDDQTLYPNKFNQVPIALARELFAVSDLRLAISAEMRETYGQRFGLPFDLLPPTIDTVEGQVPNRWQAGSALGRRCALVGNIWTESQLKLLRAMTRSTGLQVDWFGKHNPTWPPEASPERLEADGIFCQGFVSEEELASRLAAYPFVLLPSGVLDGTEDNEWLTRLSFPSRIVFILVRTLTPILVLGHAATVPGRFVTRSGLGLCTNGAPADASAKVARMTDPAERARFLANARRVAPCLVLPRSGEWIWRSLAAGRAEPAPFDELFAEKHSSATRTETRRGPSGNGRPFELRRAV